MKNIEQQKTLKPRAYIRLSTVFPVAFYLSGEQEEKNTPWLQGFTNNIARGGICLTVNDLWWGFWDKLVPGRELVLDIALPFRKKGISALVKVVWKKKEQTVYFPRYLLGLEFVKVNKKDSDLLFRYALAKKLVPRFSALLLFCLLGISFLLWQEQTELVRQNNHLLHEYRQSLIQADQYKQVLTEQEQSIDFYAQRQSGLEQDLAGLKQRLSLEQSRYQDLLTEEQLNREELASAAKIKKEIAALTRKKELLFRENEYLRRKIDLARRKREKISRRLDLARDLKKEYVPEVMHKMEQWLSTRQNLKTGLVLSYEGDDSLSRIAFTYDQALAAIVFLLTGEKERSCRIFEFYLDQAGKGRDFYNGYYTNGNVFEYVCHSGPVAWIGLAALNYTRQTGDRQFLPVAEKAADFLVSMTDKDGGIRGGPECSWYSTEHNLDAYAFFIFFHELTSEAEYAERAEKIRSWIDRFAYTDREVPVNRGKGDATIATDTYSWSITALGTESLLELGMDPEKIMDFAVRHCKVKTDFSLNGKINYLEGFDFCKARNLPRGGVVSGEWTSQMILAFEIMADHFQDKDEAQKEYYFDQARFYFEELQKMIINSPSPIGKAYPTLPYASQNGAATGHGWRTPAGDPVGSLASTAYFLIAYKGYNPLRGYFLKNSLKKEYQPQPALPAENSPKP